MAAAGSRQLTAAAFAVAALAGCAHEGVDVGPAPSFEEQRAATLEDQIVDSAARCSDPRQAPERTVEACTETLGFGAIEGGVLSDEAAAQALINRAYAHSALGSDAQALADYRFAAERAPGLYDIWPNFGWTLLRSDRVDEALAAFERGMTIDPAGREARLGRAVALLRLDRADEALEPLSTLAAEDPGDAFALLQLGRAHRALGDAPAAAGAFARALEVRPSFDVARRERAEALEEFDTDAALGEHQILITRDPEDGTRYLARARLLDRLGRSDEADRDARQAYALGERDPWLEARIAEIGVL